MTSGLSFLNVRLGFANSIAASAFLEMITANMRELIHDLVDKDLVVCDATITFSVAENTKVKATSAKGKTYNLYQASCTGKIKDKDIKPIRVPRLCCPADPPRLGARGLLQSDVPSIAQCPSATPELPLLGQCPFTTGMIVYVSESSPDASRACSYPSGWLNRHHHGWGLF